MKRSLEPKKKPGSLRAFFLRDPGAIRKGNLPATAAAATPTRVAAVAATATARTTTTATAAGLVLGFVDT